MEPLTSFAILRAHVEAWDGKLATPEKVTVAGQHAQKEAEKQVCAIESRACRVEQANMAAQHKAAALRLSRELARLLRCLDASAADLQQLAETQAARSGPLAERIRLAKHRLGGKFAWTEQTRWELEQFLKGLSANDKQSRLSGSSLDAALADYRWDVLERVARPG
jgi:hypothetical protein